MRTTARHFEEFKRYHEGYVRRYGLIKWRVYYEHDNGDEEYYADTSANYTGKIVLVRLSVKWGEGRPLNSSELRKLAKHEANHLLLSDLYWHAKARFISTDTLIEAEEAVVRTLDQLIPD